MASQCIRQKPKYGYVDFLNLWLSSRQVEGIFAKSGLKCRDVVLLGYQRILSKFSNLLKTNTQPRVKTPTDHFLGCFSFQKEITNSDELLQVFQFSILQTLSLSFPFLSHLHLFTSPYSLSTLLFQALLRRNFYFKSLLVAGTYPVDSIISSKSKLKIYYLASFLLHS